MDDMPRKTIEIEKLVNIANTALMYNRDHNNDYRLGVISMIENILHLSGNYKGFRYLSANELPEGMMPGINVVDGEIPPYPERFDNTDNTRRKYM
jgi:hypothetical protein